MSDHESLNDGGLPTAFALRHQAIMDRVVAEILAAASKGWKGTSLFESLPHTVKDHLEQKGYVITDIPESEAVSRFAGFRTRISWEE